mgnify:CR=1 FL=1
MPVPSVTLAYGTTPAPIDAPSPQPPNVLDTLYAAALGSTGAAHYLPPFTHFGTLGRTRTTWNSAAAFFTIAWLVYRKLWSVALAYVVLMEGIAIAWFVGIRPSLSLPLPVEAGLALAWLTLSVALPGLWGDALVYNDVHKRTMRSLEAASTLAQARTELEREAPSRRRLHVLVALQALVIVATLAALLWPNASWRLAPTTAETPPDASAPAQAPLPTADEVLASMALAAAPAASEPASSPTAEPSAHVEALADSVPTAPASAPSATSDEPAANPSAALPNPATPPVNTAAAPPPLSAPPATAEKRPAKSVASALAATERGQAKATVRSTPPVQPPPIQQTLESKRYYVNVGVFADEANALKVQRQLQQAKLPLVVQSVGTNKGERIRVRAGPFTSQEKARAAATQARALGLEAVVFHHQ